MLVPEATVYKHDSFVFWQYNIRFSGKCLVVKAIAQAAGMQELAYQQLRLGILSFNLRHVVAASSGGMYIGHSFETSGWPVRCLLHPETIAIS